MRNTCGHYKGCPFGPSDGLQILYGLYSVSFVPAAFWAKKAMSLGNGLRIRSEEDRRTEYAAIGV
jgi:hypothetical protein